MPAYNKRQGWEKGNLVLHQFAGELQTHFPEALLFRAYGNDFAVVSREHLQLDGEELDSFAGLGDTGITITVHHVDLAREKKYTLDKLENMELRSNT